MKRYIILFLMLLSFGTGAVAQSLVMDASTKLYGYRNSDGAWQLAPQFGYAYPFEGHFKRFAVVELDRYWGCVDTGAR